MKVRLATHNDVPALLAIKSELRFAGSSRGGFLLGATESGYRERIDNGRVWVLESRESVCGFAVTLMAPMFVNTPMWEMRHHVKWTQPFDVTLDQGVGYFDQLAVRRNTPARAAALLGFVALRDLLQVEHAVVTTTVVAPVCNRAAVPFIERVGGLYVGEIDEVHDGFGPLTSGVWLITREEVERRVYNARACGPANVLSSLQRASTRALVPTLSQPSPDVHVHKA